MDDYGINALDSELALIGALLLDDTGKQANAVKRIINESDIENAELRFAYQLILQALDTDGKTDFAVIASKAGVNKPLLMEACEKTGYVGNAPKYAKSVREASLKRMAATLCDDIGNDLVSGVEVNEIIAKVKSFGEDVRPVGEIKAISSQDAMNKFVMYRRQIDMDGIQVISTGYQSLDRILGGGFIKSGFYIIAARPGMGKTTVSANLADNIAKNGKTVIYYSLEMTDNQISARRLGRHTRIPYEKLMLGKFDKDDYATLLKSIKELSKAPMLVRSGSKLTVNDIEAEIEAVHPDCIIVDYIGLMTTPYGKKSRYEEMTYLSGEMKRLALKSEIPIICLAQLNRENTKGVDKRPNMANLRDSGAMEQDADGIILLHRPEYYEDPAQAKNGVETLEMIVGKNRHGRTGTAQFAWYGATGIIREIYNHQS